MVEIQPIPEGFTAVTPHLHIKGAAKAIDFYKKAFGAEEITRISMPNDPNIIMHAQLRFFGAPVMVVDALEEWGQKEPLGTGGSTVTVHLYVEDCDAVFERAVASGCKSTMEPNDAFWGDRFAAIIDPFGHHWSIATHICDPSPEEMAEAAEKAFGKQ